MKTLKRDYAGMQPRPASDTTLTMVNGWIIDNNEHHLTDGSACARLTSSPALKPNSCLLILKGATSDGEYLGAVQGEHVGKRPDLKLASPTRPG